MNTAAKTLIIAITAVTAAAAAGLGLASFTAAPATEVVKLERVVVIGKRAETAVIAKLPRVVVEGRRAVQSDVNVASTRKSGPRV